MGNALLSGGKGEGEEEEEDGGGSRGEVRAPWARRAL